MSETPKDCCPGYFGHRPNCASYKQPYHAHPAAPPGDGGTLRRLREQLAALAHEQWSGWMRYLFSRCSGVDPVTGHVTIPAEWVQRWRRQVETPYAELSEAEKNSDREEADRVLALVGAALDAQQQKIVQWEGRALKAEAQFTEARAQIETLTWGRPRR